MTKSYGIFHQPGTFNHESGNSGTLNTKQEQKRLQEQHAVEQEALFGSRSATKKPLGQSTTANTIVGTPNGRRMLTPSSRYGTSGGKERRESVRGNNIIPVNYVALPKDDSVSRGS